MYSTSVETHAFELLQLGARTGGARSLSPVMLSMVCDYQNIMDVSKRLLTLLLADKCEEMTLLTWLVTAQTLDY